MKGFLGNLICILDHNEFLESGQRFSKVSRGLENTETINLKGAELVFS